MKRILIFFTTTIIILTTLVYGDDNNVAKYSAPYIINDIINAINTTEFTVEADSDFYNEPNGILASFDDDNDNYTAALEETLPNWFVVRLDKPLLLKNISIEWYSTNDYAKEFSVYGYSNGSWIEIANETDYVNSKNELIYDTVLEEPVEISKLKMEVKKTNGQYRMLIRNVKLNYETNSNESLINNIYKVNLIISKHFNYGAGISYGERLEAIINSKEGNCSHTAYVIARYLESLGLNTRLIGVFAKNGNNHLLTEVLINNKWILIDASNGVIYPHSAMEIAGNLAYLGDIIGKPNESKIYTTREFWQNISEVKIHSLHDIELPLWIDIKASSGNFIEPNNGANASINYDDKTGYAAANSSDSDKPTWIEFDLQEAKEINRVCIDWYDSKNYAKDFSLYGSVDGVEYFKIIEKTDYDSNYADHTDILMKKKVRYLRLSSTEYNGQDRLLLRSIKFYSDPFDWDDFIENNKLKYNEYNISEVDMDKFRDLAVYTSVKQLTSEILSDSYSKLTQHQKIVLFMDWMDDNIEVGLGKADSLYTINKKIGACGSLSNLLIAMAETEGMEGRLINLYNYPKPGLGHTVAEIKWGDKWRLYDPTYQAYYLNSINDISNYNNPEVASFSDIKKNPEIVRANRIVLNVKSLFKALSYTNADGEIVLSDSGIYTSSDAYINAYPAGPIGADIPMLFPAEFELEKGFFIFGTDNNDVIDMEDINMIPQGLYMLGSSFHNVDHKYILNGLVPGRQYVVNIGIIDTNISDFFVNIISEGVQTEIKEQDIIKRITDNNSKVFSIPFKAIDDNGYIIIDHNYTDIGKFLLIDFIEIKLVEN